jgi:ABC-2 type transport system permease protein
MRTLRFLLRKEFRQIFRDPSIIRLILVMPVIQLLILPWAADYEIKKIKLAVVDHDHSEYSRQLINKITSSGYFILTIILLPMSDHWKKSSMTRQTWFYNTPAFRKRSCKRK